MDPLTSLGSIGAGANIALRLIQGGYQYASVPEDVEQLLLGLESFDETIKTTRTLRRIKSHLMDEREKNNVDQAIETSNSVLHSIRQTVESCRKDLVTKDRVTAKNRLLWLAKNHDAFVARGWTVTMCMQSLSSHIMRMSVLQQSAAPPKHLCDNKRTLRPPARRLARQSSDTSLTTTRPEDVDDKFSLSPKCNEAILTLAQRDRSQEKADIDVVKPNEGQYHELPCLEPVITQSHIEDFPEVVPSFPQPQTTRPIGHGHQLQRDDRYIPYQWPEQDRHVSAASLSYKAWSPSMRELPRQEGQYPGIDHSYEPWSPEMHNIKLVELPGSEIQSSTTIPQGQLSQRYEFSRPPLAVPISPSCGTSSPPPVLLSPPPSYWQTAIRTKSSSSSVSSLNVGERCSNPAASVAHRARQDSFGSTLSPSISTGSEPERSPSNPTPRRRIKSMFIT